ncbi:unnamed protein product [Closterium sp. NIES-65]|nr:unnamed protein product [Closterium sp. NIES-65]
MLHPHDRCPAMLIHPSPSLSPLPSRRPRSLPSLPVALSLSPPFPSPSLSPLTSRRPLSLPSLPGDLALSPPFPSPSLSLLPSRRPLSPPSLPVAIALSSPFPSPSLSLSLPSLPVALALSPPFPSPSSSPLPSRRHRKMQSSCSSRPSSLPSHHPTSFRDFCTIISLLTPRCDLCTLISLLTPRFRRPVAFFSGHPANSLVFPFFLFLDAVFAAIQVFG